MGKRKSVITWLRKQSEVLPQETYLAFHKYFKPEWQKMEDGNIGRVNGEAEHHPVNHARRLKRIFKKEGKKGVDKYFLDRDFKLIKK